MKLIDVEAFKKWLMDNSINASEIEESKQIGIWIDAFYSMQNEQSDCEDCIKHGGDWECDRVHCHKGDAISRQAAIEAVIKRDANCGIDSAEVLKLLPSAQPEIIRCKDCSFYDGRPCGIVDWYNTEDDFCSKAYPREGDAE